MKIVKGEKSTQQKVIEFLASHRHRWFTINDLSEELGIQKPALWSKMHNLSKGFDNVKKKKVVPSSYKSRKINVYQYQQD